MARREHIIRTMEKWTRTNKLQEIIKAGKETKFPTLYKNKRTYTKKKRKKKSKGRLKWSSWPIWPKMQGNKEMGASFICLVAMKLYMSENK